MSDFLIDEFYSAMTNVDLNVYGILDSKERIHTLGTDSKIIGRVFEMISQPILEEIAEKHGLILRTPKSQTVYPDFVMMESVFSKRKIAIDIKTTYVESSRSNIVFTLGSYGSYIRNNTGNIEFKYTDYEKHYVIGYVYKRNGCAQESRVYTLDNKEKIAFPYYDVKYFIQEKYKIAGDKPGSGNTENIGSFQTTDFNALKNGEGPFSELGADVFDLYWKYYPKYRAIEKPYTSLSEFFKWFLKQERSLTLFHPIDYDSIIKKALTYIQNH